MRRDSRYPGLAAADDGMEPPSPTAIVTKQATPLGELLKMDSDAMSQPHYAEGWTLVGLLYKQPAKFGKLLLELRKGGSDLAAIEKVYGWDEEKLTEQWRKYVMAQGGKGVPKRP